MNYTEHKKLYQERMTKFGQYTTKLTKPTLDNHHKVIFLSETNSLRMTSNAHFEGDTLFIIPLYTNVGPVTKTLGVKKSDLIVFIDYWSTFAKWKGLHTIHLIPKKFGDVITKTWDNLNELLTIFEQMGFAKKNGNAFEILVEDIPDLIDMQMTIVNVLNAIHEKDLSFTFNDLSIAFYDLLKSDSFAFYQVHFEWRGISKDLLFHCRNKSYSLFYDGIDTPFTEETLSDTIESILQKIEDSVKLKNLLDPPFVNVSKLLKAKWGFIKSDISVSLGKNIMEAFINAGFSFEEVEIEAVRMKESNYSKTNNSTLPYKELLFHFFDSHYLAIIYSDRCNTDFVVSENIDDIIAFHNKHLQKLVEKRFASFH